MNKHEVLALMLTAKPLYAAEWESLLSIYAERLARVAPKLAEDELRQLVAVGAAIHQCRRHHASAEREASALLLRMRGRLEG